MSVVESLGLQARVWECRWGLGAGLMRWKLGLGQTALDAAAAAAPAPAAALLHDRRAFG